MMNNDGLINSPGPVPKYRRLMLKVVQSLANSLLEPQEDNQPVQ